MSETAGPAGEASGPVAEGSRNESVPNGAWPEPIVVAPWRWRVWASPAIWLNSVATFVALILVMGVTLFGGFFAVGMVEGLKLEGVVAFVANAAALVMVAVLSGMALRHVMRGASGRMAASFAGRVAADAPARAFMFAELAERGPPTDSWSEARARRWVHLVREGRHARAYLPEPLAERVARYDRTDRPVEPETIGGGMVRGDVARATACAALGTLLLWMRGWNVITIICGVAVAVIAWRMIRRRAMFAPVVAGAGWVQHGHARWTIDDSVLVATGRGTARTCIVGPPGVLVLRLRTARHRDFETLWVRWMHPDPKPDQPAFDA